LARRDGVVRYPARCQLMLAANPCPCAPPDERDCICAPSPRRRYLGRLSGPLLDRVDLRSLGTLTNAEAREGWVPRDAFERAAMDRLTSGIQLDLGQLDAAEQFAASAVRTYGDTHLRRGRTRAELTLAEVYVRAGEPRGLVLARQAIDAVSSLQSVAVRRERLVPLATALEARPGSDAKELARMAHQVAATRV
jgi:Magnesium chelatase, subunit ChlI